MSDTPRTDAIASMATPYKWENMRDLARTLERELAEEKTLNSNLARVVEDRARGIDPATERLRSYAERLLAAGRAMHTHLLELPISQKIDVPNEVWNPFTWLFDPDDPGEDASGPIHPLAKHGIQEAVSSTPDQGST